MPTATAERWAARPAEFWDPATPTRRGPDGSVHIHSYAGVERMLADPSLTTDWYAGTDRSQLIPVMAGLWMTDGERRRRLRAALVSHFGGRAMATISGAVDLAVSDLLTRIIHEHPEREFEAVEALGIPLPGLIMARLLGIDPDAAMAMATWRNEVWTAGGDMSGMAPHSAMSSQLIALLELRRSDPAPGLLDELLRAQDEGFQPLPGERLDDWEIVGQLAMLLWAAVGNTSGAIADALLFLTEFGHWPQLRTDPTLVPGAVEEVLRWYPSFPAIYRQASTPITIDGLDIPTGTAVTGWLTSAHRDPAVFPDPDTFDIRRHPNRHLALGRGSHFCLGAHFVRILLQSTVRLTAERMPQLRRNRSFRPVRREWLEDSLDHLVMLF